jgi:hypothetical protein
MKPARCHFLLRGRSPIGEAQLPAFQRARQDLGFASAAPPLSDFMSSEIDGKNEFHLLTRQVLKHRH